MSMSHLGKVRGDSFFFDIKITLFKLGFKYKSLHLLPYEKCHIHIPCTTNVSSCSEGFGVYCFF